MRAKCSRAGCQAEAKSLIEWRNPKVHSPDRVKTWAGCDDHTRYLIDYLEARKFFLGTKTLEHKHD